MKQLCNQVSELIRVSVSLFFGLLIPVLITNGRYMRFPAGHVYKTCVETRVKTICDQVGLEIDTISYTSNEPSCNIVVP